MSASKRASKTVKLVADDLKAIDKVQPYQNGDGVLITVAAKRAKERTKAWLKAPKGKKTA